MAAVEEGLRVWDGVVWGGFGVVGGGCGEGRFLGLGGLGGGFGVGGGFLWSRLWK